MVAPLIRIVLLQNDVLLRAGLRLLIESQPGMKIVGEGENNIEGIDLVSSQKPDIALLVVNHDDPLNIETVSSLIKVSKHTRPILITGVKDNQFHQKAIENGVVGVIFNTQLPEILFKAIQKVNAGEVWLERSMIANVLSRISRNQPFIKSDPEMDNITHLTEREKQVIRLIGEGSKNKDIATELCISEATVRHHLTSIYGKLGVSDRLELLVYAHRKGLIINTTSRDHPA